MDKVNPFRNSEKDELVNAVRAVLSGQEYTAPEKEVEEHKGDKPHKHPHEENEKTDTGKKVAKVDVDPDLKEKKKKISAGKAY